MSQRRSAAILALILAAGAALRLYGLDWDGGQWLHPDERQIYFAALRLAWPGSLAGALSPASALNPQFFAYGCLPIYLARLAALALAPFWPAVRDPGNLHLAGRPLAVLFDLGTVALVYRLAGRLWPAPDGRGRAVGLAAAALVSLAAIHVQIAHFYTADTLLAFFAVLVLYLAAGAARTGRLRDAGVLGLALGLALATKITAAPLAAPALVALWLPAGPRGLPAFARRAAVALGAAALAFSLAQPYALVDWPAFLTDTARESQIAWGRLDVPYTRQYAGTLPYLYPMWQMAAWGLGLPLGLAAWSGLAAGLVRWLRRGDPADALLLAWAGPALALAGALYAKPPRYLLPVVPVLCLLAARLLLSIPRAWPRLVLLCAAIVPSLAYAVACAAVYVAPHPWIAASEWIYRRVPPGAALAVEAWDTALPLPLELDGRSRRIEEYRVRALPLYDEPDDAAKWATLAADLAASDYVVIASRRGYGALARLPGRYPYAARYYERLFGGDLGFEPAGEWTRGPAWLNPRLSPLPGAVPRWLAPDESLVVYDRPRVLIWRNRDHLAAEELLRRLAP